MKYCILGDLHLINKDSSIFVEYYEKFFDELIEYLLDNNIDTIIQLGDLFNTRKSSNNFTIHHSKRILFDKLLKNNIRLDTLLGNHDIFYKDTLDINTTTNILRDYDNITIISSPMSINGISYIPWICKSNYDEVFEYIKKDTNSICLGHFEFSGFCMYKGVESRSGISPEEFSKYKMVLSGHYHTRSNKGNVTYVGTPYELCWHDCGDPRGFHILEDGVLTFVPNNNTIFEKIIYTGKDVDLDRCKGKFIQLVVEKKPDVIHYNKTIDSLNELEINDLSIIDKDEIITEDVEVDESEDTVSILNKYINDLDSGLDNNMLKRIVFDVYQTAIRI